jgi:UDP-N-acetylglucosamine 2-epimerase
MEEKIKIDWSPIIYNEEAIKKAASKGNVVLMVTLATKPCFYKLWSIIQEAKKNNLPYLILHTGQHYDDLVGHGIKEMQFDIAIDLQIRGDLSQKTAELSLKIKNLATYLSKKYPDKEFVPYANGDTLAAAMVPAAWMFATNKKAIHGEAGLRGMAPNYFHELKESISPEDLVQKEFSLEWSVLRNEPFPEQWDTFVAGAASQFHFAPVKLNAAHLMREGYPTDTIFQVGNTVVDVIELKKKLQPEESIFNLYPKLENDEWLRVDIHRRGNLTEKRFKAIIGTVQNLVKQGKNVCFIELNATKKALEYFNLRKKLQDLENNKNFLFTPLWKEYAHVIEFLESKNCWAILTDSGSMQEEMNELQKPCFTTRFNTDRPETVMFANSNLLVPPISSDFMTKVMQYCQETMQDQMKNKDKLYGHNVADKITTQIKKLFEDPQLFRWAHEELKLYKEDKNGLKYL